MLLRTMLSSSFDHENIEGIAEEFKNRPLPVS